MSLGRLKLTVRTRRLFFRKTICIIKTKYPTHTLLFRLSRTGLLYRLESVLVSVTYDGATIKVVPNPIARAKLCGVCGDYDGDSRNDIVNKDGHPVDHNVFLESWCK